MGTSPAQPAEDNNLCGVQDILKGALLDEFCRAAEIESVGLTRAEFCRILWDVGAKGNVGLGEGEGTSREQRVSYLRGLKLRDLALARSCAAGSERGWELFIAEYRQPLVRAAIAITRSETLGGELANQLYGELYGLTERHGERKCPLESYCGRGSLMGWLRTILAQRHVDHLRKGRREEPLEEFDMAAPEMESGQPQQELTQLERAVEAAIGSCEPEVRLMLAAYYLDGRTLLEIGRVLGIHEATVSRKLKRVCEDLRKQILKQLQGLGMSRRAAEDALGIDPRDLDVNLKKLLQNSQVDAFKEQAAQ